MRRRVTLLVVAAVLLVAALVHTQGAQLEEGPRGRSESPANCSFIKEIDKILRTPPEVAISKNSLAPAGRFLSVADGIVPSRPGFSAGDEMACAMEHHEFAMVWAGADAISCTDQLEHAARMLEYAERYNALVKAALAREGHYQCTPENLELVSK